jgi:predicted dehydrogenase
MFPYSLDVKSDNFPQKTVDLAFVGFRHGHIFDLYERAKAHPNVRVTAVCEENFPSSLLTTRPLPVDFDDFDQMMAESDCEAVAIGDCYGRRGSLVVRALQAGKHVIADKPLCTRMAEWEEISDLERATGLRVGLMLDLRDSGNALGLREVVRSGRIGPIQTMSFAGQHPLIRSTRPAWYFEPGMHGGTLNDIAVHALDLIPWLSGLQVAEITASRTWNAKAADVPDFRDCGQFMLRLSNGGGVIGDVSYLAPDRCGYKTDNYWKIILHGTQGFAETSWNAPGILVADDSDPNPALIPPAPPRPGGYLEDFLADVAGSSGPDALKTQDVLAVSRLALELQQRSKE